MHIFFEEVRAFVASMPIKNPKVTTARPSAFEVWFGYVHNDGDSIFIIIFDKSVKCIDCVPLDCSIGSLNEFNRLYLRDINSLFLLILIHDLTIISI